MLGAIRVAVETLDARPDWVAKDPRLCLTLPLWLQIIRPSCIVLHRDPLEVAQSLHSRDGLPIHAGIALWEAYVRQALANSEGLDRLFIDHAELVTEPERTILRIDEWLAHRRASARAPGTSAPPVRTTLVRNHSTPEDAAAHLDPRQRQLLAEITQLTRHR